MDVKEIHKACIYNRDKLKTAKVCGCFYCLKVFSPKEIVEWCDGGETAICPFCRIDAVLPDIDNKDFLQKMYEFWFETEVNPDEDEVWHNR